MLKYIILLSVIIAIGIDSHAQKCSFNIDSFDKRYEVDTTLIDSLFNREMVVVFMKIAKEKYDVTNRTIKFSDSSFIQETKGIALSLHADIYREKRSVMISVFDGPYEVERLTLHKLCEEKAIFTISQYRGKVIAGKAQKFKDVGYVVVKWKN